MNEQILNKGLDELYISYNDRYILSTKLNIVTIGDLISHEYRELKSFIPNSIRNVASDIHLMGLEFKGEYESIHLPLEVARIRLDSFKDLDRKVFNALKSNGIDTIGELLTTEYYKITDFTNMGEKSISNLKDFVHKLGYTLKNENLNMLQSKAREGNPVVLEDLGFSKQLCMNLYAAKIYTMDDLLRYGVGVFNLPRIKPSQIEELKNKMHEYGVDFEDSLKVINKTSKADYLIANANPTNEEVDELKEGNELLKSKIEYKKKLIEEYKNLVLLNASLEEQNQALDLMIQSLSEEKNAKL